MESAPPGSPIDRNNQLKHSNWFETQLGLATLIGTSSLLLFCYTRSRLPSLFSPRHHLLLESQSIITHAQQVPIGFFAWILPTLNTSDQIVLNLIGLDALALLYFFKLGFYYFLTITLIAFLFLVPINLHENGTTEGVPPDPTTPPTQNFTHPYDSSTGDLPLHLTQNISLYSLSHLFFTYIFSLLLLRLLRSTYLKLISINPSFSLTYPEVRNSLRTVIIRQLPLHLQNDKALADYFNQVLRYPTESNHVLKDITGILPFLHSRTQALETLELGYTRWLGHPDSIPITSTPNLTGTPSSQNLPSDLERAHDGLVTNAIHQRPRYRPHWLSFKTTDWIDHWTHQFRQADELVRRRRTGKFKPLPIGFVTFKNLIHAQILCQTTHWPVPEQAVISLAPDSKNIYWPNITISPISLGVRRAVVWICMALLYGFWAPPVSFLANLMSYDVLVSWLSPMLVKMIEKSTVIKALIQNSLPTLAIILFNALLPFLLNWLCIFQGFESRSTIEYSLMKKYHLFLLVTVLFIFVAVSTFSLLRDLRDNPGGVIDKVAKVLPGARNFFISYLILQSLSVLPLQLLQLPSLFLRLITRARTPRQYRLRRFMSLEILNLGTIYPQALLAFNICITYSVIAPIILIFGTAYFGIGYLVYKYKILNVYHRPFESRGQAWPMVCNRIGWGLIIFQVFMLGLLSLRKVFLLSTLVLPLIAYTVYYLVTLDRAYRHHARFISLSQICEADLHGESLEQDDSTHPSSQVPSETGRPSDDPNEIAEEAISVIQPEAVRSEIEKDLPGEMRDIFIGIEDYGAQPYGHPALTGQLPMPQVPTGVPSEDGDEARAQV